MVLLFALLAACAPNDPVPNDVPEVPMAPAPAPLPPPFTATQIRDGMPQGLRIVYRTQSPGEPPEQMLWEVVAHDAQGLTLRTTISREGELLDGPNERQQSWDELESHAHFPGGAAERSQGPIQVPAGSYEGWIYEVDLPDGMHGRFEFASALPGAPVRMTQTSDGAEVYRMELMGRSDL